MSAWKNYLLNQVLCILLAPNYLITLPKAWNKKLRMGLINQGSMLQLPHQITTPYSPMTLLLHCTVLNSFLQQTEQESSFISTASFKSQKIPMMGAHLHMIIGQHTQNVKIVTHPDDL